MFKSNSIRRPWQARGFNLIELLVVVAIIALLISILLPSLSKARSQAKTVACAAALSQLGKAENLYQTDNNGWIPGSPWSTGYWLLTSPPGPWDPNRPGFPRFVLDWFDYSTPLRALMQRNHSIPLDRYELFKLFTAEPFHCPANNQKAVPYPLGTSAGPKDIPAVSYLSMLPIMRAGPDAYNKVIKNPSLFPGVTAGHIAQRSTWEMRVPDGYVPRHNRLGRESMKVFLADGLRFYDPVQGLIDYDTSSLPKSGSGIARASKGISNIEEPPSTAGNNFDNMYNIAREFAYRHGDNDRINAVFFDGHVELLLVNYKNATIDLKNFTGPAVHPKWYYPSGTVVSKPSYNHLQLSKDMALP
jgi:prepilin-type N-terminal cleavage/methylation domain-containing protein/prepilin-type processing-associated H-X9-DG protein